jgi:hypothetical protein
MKGKYAIHPAQVEMLNRVFSPSADELEEARRIVAAYEEAAARGIGAISVHGRMIDEPIVRAARDLAGLGTDVLKTEFPGDAEACRRLDEASPVPWVLLSAGVEFETFARQLEVACRAGASGFLGGRAVWEDGLRIADPVDRRRWLRTVAADRMRRLHEIARRYGRPWWKKYGDTLDAIAPVDAAWYRTYPDAGERHPSELRRA